MNGVPAGEADFRQASLSHPFHRFQVTSQFPGTAKFLCNQCPLKPFTDVFNLLRLPRIVALSTDSIVEDANEVVHVMLNILCIGSTPVEHIQQFEFESQAISQHDDVVGM